MYLGIKILHFKNTFLLVYDLNRIALHKFQSFQEYCFWNPFDTNLYAAEWIEMYHFKSISYKQFVTICRIGFVAK